MLTMMQMFMSHLDQDNLYVLLYHFIPTINMYSCCCLRLHEETHLDFKRRINEKFKQYGKQKSTCTLNT